MEKINIFISVGTPCNEQQAKFIDNIFTILREYDINPCTIGENNFATKNPLQYILELMKECCGTIVIALERVYLSDGQEKRGGSNEHDLHNQIIPTVWNHIEAAMAYTLQLPILVITEEGSRQEGLLEECYGWRVLSVPTNNKAINSDEFRGVIKAWAEQVRQSKKLNK